MPHIHDHALDPHDPLKAIPLCLVASHFHGLGTRLVYMHRPRDSTPYHGYNTYQLSRIFS